MQVKKFTKVGAEVLSTHKIFILLHKTQLSFTQKSRYSTTDIANLLQEHSLNDLSESDFILFGKEGEG
jgi:hypothetical protein